MKKTISIFSILFGLIFIHSCRQEEENQTIEELKDYNTLKQRSTAKITDSANVTVNEIELGDDDTIDEGDPPPKNGGQWKVQH